MNRIERALISVSDKTGVIELAKAVAALGAEILSTGGTAKALREAGLSVLDVAAYTGSPEILDGRVKTLHPKVHGGLLGRRSNPRHAAEMAEQGIGPIDLVIVNLYPFEATIAKPEVAKAGFDCRIRLGRAIHRQSTPVFAELYHELRGMKWIGAEAKPDERPPAK